MSVWMVTGGLGYVGRHVVDVLVAAGREVLVVDNLSRGQVLGDRRHDVSVVTADVGERAVMDDILRRWDVAGVIHLASRIDGADSVRDPLSHYLGNAVTTATMLDALLRRGVRRVVFASSAAVYGQNFVRKPHYESDDPRPVTPYGETKTFIEEMLSWSVDAYHLSFVALRIFNVVGMASPEMPVPEPLGFISRAARSAVRGEPIVIYDGSGVRDYVDVRDVARAFVRAVSLLEDDARYGVVCNVGTGVATSVDRIVQRLAYFAGHPLEIRPEGPRDGDVRHSLASIESAERVLDWRPRFKLDESIQSVFRWHEWREGKA